jgi:hypothetical protein
VRQLPSDDQLLQQFSANRKLKTRVDDDGTVIVPGKLGHIYQYDHHHLGVVVVPRIPRMKYWGLTRRKLLALQFTVVQDGDGEGAAVFDPANAEQVRAAIKAAGIIRKRQLSPAQVNRQLEWLRASAGRAL